MKVTLQFRLIAMALAAFPFDDDFHDEACAEDDTTHRRALPRPRLTRGIAA
jgi:hypothetical protein